MNKKENVSHEAQASDPTLGRAWLLDLLLVPSATEAAVHQVSSVFHHMTGSYGC